MTPRSRFIHMLPAVANNIKRHFSAMDARLQRAVDSSSLEEVTNRSPVKEAVKAENAALKHELADWRARSSEARAQVSLLEGEIATIHRTHVGARAVTRALGDGGGEEIMGISLKILIRSYSFLFACLNGSFL